MNLSDGPVYIVDFGAGSISEDSPGESVDATVTASHESLAQLLRGEIEPRFAQMYGRFVVEGSNAVVTRCFEEVWERASSYVPEYTSSPELAITDDPLEAVDNLRMHGYVILTDILPADLFERLYERVVEQAAAEAAAGVAYYDKNVVGGSDKSQRVWCLHNKGSECREFLIAPKFHVVAREMLGADYQLSDLQATFIAPGSPAQVLHCDQIWAETVIPLRLGVTFVFALDEFTADNGATRVIPGSHVHNRGMAPDDIFVESGATIPALVPRNSAVMIDSRVWHGAGANATDDQRRAIILGFKRSWVRASSNGPLSVRPEVLDGFGDFEKTLFGFKATGVNRLEHHMEGMIFDRAPERLVGEMHL